MGWCLLDQQIAAYMLECCNKDYVFYIIIKIVDAYYYTTVELVI